MKSMRVARWVMLLASLPLTGCYRWEYVEYRTRPAALEVERVEEVAQRGLPVSGATPAASDSIARLFPLGSAEGPTTETWRVKVKRLDTQRTAGLIALSTVVAVYVASWMVDEGSSSRSSRSSSSGTGPFGCWFSC